MSRNSASPKPRVVPAGQNGLFSISLQSLTNVDTPYVHFSFGVTELGDNAKVYGLPYTTFSSNVAGRPDGGLRSDVGCDFSQNVVATVASPATSYVDDSLPAGLPVFYRVQARGANGA